MVKVVLLDTPLLKARRRLGFRPGGMPCQRIPIGWAKPKSASFRDWFVKIRPDAHILLWAAGGPDPAGVPTNYPAREFSTAWAEYNQGFVEHPAVIAQCRRLCQGVSRRRFGQAVGA